MLVQLSPYKTVKTSIQLATNSRRRKRNDNEGSDLAVEASFVTTSSRRGQQKWKQHSEEFLDTQPVLLVSSDHQISIIGRKNKDDEYDEFSNLRYSSRPGTVSSFGPPPTSNTKTKDHLPRIPPILDAKNDQVYALQHGNARLCSWNALTGNGPDEASAVKVDLVQPAVSMSLLSLHKGVVYGSCLDGTIFIARLGSDTDGTGTFLVEYLSNKRCGNQRHVGTVAEIPHGQGKGLGRKRKMSDAEGGTMVHFYQVFHNDKGIQLFRHEVQFERFSTGEKIILESHLNERDVLIPLLTEIEGILMTATLNTCTTEASKAAVSYQVKTQHDSIKHFSALLSLSAGNLTHYRVELPDETLQHGMISESMLVVGTKQSLYLIDLETGSTLYKLALPKDICESTNKSWLLRADSKFGTLTVLHENDGVLSCDTSSLTIDDQQQVTQANTKLSLASKLASSVLNAKAHAGTGTTLVVNNLLSLHSPKQSKGDQTLEVAIQQALNSIHEARIKSITPSVTSVDAFIFMNTYEEAVAMLLTALNNTSNLESAGGQNPQDDVHCNGHGKLNGVSNKASKNGLSHQSPRLPHVRAVTPPILPQTFLDGATQIVLKLLRAEPSEDRTLSRRIMLARLDARVILSRLLNTGKLSARLHFDGTESIETISNSEHVLTTTLRSVKLSHKRGRRVFTPVDMMFTMLQKCPDVSERQMVVMLHYMMRRALPEDVAEMFFDERKYGLHNQHVLLAQKFFALRTSLFKTAGSNDKVQSPELDRLGHRLILAGTSYLLYRIISYSQCNEPMLRVALQDTIETQEALILARVLSNMLASSRRKDVITRTPPSVGAMKTICQWAAAITDSFHDDLAATRGVNGQSFLAGLLSAVKLTTKHSQEIMSLREDVQRVESEIHATLHAKNNPAPARVLANQEDLPGYSVEILRF